MSLAVIVQAMADAGCTAHQIAAAVRAYEEAGPVRSKHAEAQARYRAKKADHARSAVITSDHADHPTDEQKENSPTPPIRKTTSLTNVRENSSARDADFDRLRQAYPKRVGGDPRKSALKAFHAALKRGADAETIIAGAQAFAAFRSNDDPKFTPMLATWLNRDGWGDDYTSPPPRAGPAPPQRSVLSRIAMGTFFDEQSAHDKTDEQPAPRAAVARGRGAAGEVPERDRADACGPVVDLRPTGSGWGRPRGS